MQSLLCIPRASNVPFLVTAAVATERVDVTIGVAVQTKSGCEVPVRLRVRRNGGHGECQDGRDNGRPTDGKEAILFAQLSNCRNVQLQLEIKLKFCLKFSLELLY